MAKWYRRTSSKKIADVVCERGPLTVDDLMTIFPEHSRAYLQKTLSNAKALGLIRLSRRGVGGPGQRQPGLWSAPQIGLVTSVWDLAEPRNDVLQTMTGRQYSPLGDWPEYQPREAA